MTAKDNFVYLLCDSKYFVKQKKEDFVTHENIQSELEIIKTMVAKTRRATAESGHFFIASGLFLMAAAFVIYIIETSENAKLIIPAIVALPIGSGIIGYLTVNRAAQKEKVVSYAKHVFSATWFSCGIPSVMILLLFPLTGVMPWNLAPALISLIAGTGLFITGNLFEMKSITWCSLVWWGGGCLLAYSIVPEVKIVTMESILFFGWVMPGWLLNRTYKKRNSSHEA